MELNLPNISTLEEALETSKVDKETWDVDDWAIRFWTMALGEGQTDVASHISVKLRRKHPLEADLTRILESFSESGPTYATPKSRPTGILYEPALFDIHVGKLASALEVGSSTNLSNTKKKFEVALSTLLHYGEPFAPEEILFPIGNDFLHVDTLKKTTTEGTPQDTENIFEAFRTGIQMLTSAIYDMLQISPKVRVLLIPGNHDQMSSVFLSYVVAAWFRNDARVTVDTSPQLRKYHRWGKVLLGFTHGKYEKKGMLPLLMAQEARELWAATEYREWHLGHLHDASLQETQGVRVRRIPSLSGIDAWHYRQGFVGNVPAAESYLWHKDTAFVGHFSSTGDGQIPSLDLSSGMLSPSQQRVRDVMLVNTTPLSRKELRALTGLPKSTLNDALVGLGDLVQEVGSGTFVWGGQ